eukprot:631681-Hanusia_phi.AAC.1
MHIVRDIWKRAEERSRSTNELSADDNLFNASRQLHLSAPASIAVPMICAVPLHYHPPLSP